MSLRPLRVLLGVIDLDGGAGTFCRSLAASLRLVQSPGFLPDLLVLRNRGLLPGDESIFSAIHLCDGVVGLHHDRWWQGPRDLVRIRRQVSQLQPDIVLGVGSYFNILAPLSGVAGPFILTEHAAPEARLRDSVFPNLMRTLMRLVYPQHMLLGVSEGVAKGLGDLVSARAHAVHSGLDAARVTLLARQDPGAAPGFVACGRMSREKDFATIIEAYAIARREGLKSPLTLVGDGPSRPVLESQARRLGLEGFIRMPGALANPYPLIARATAFLFASHWEGFGYSLLEAMALGVPCVATDAPTGPRELTDNGRYGVLVPPRDAGGMARAMVRIERDPAYAASLAALARERSQRFSLARMGEAYAELILRAIGGER